ncbi:penicillin-binding protein 1A [Actimicrobium sp. CCI2.3]|nr:penicillin-binding protein 1A [Actimicrobium sp. CCI2.3]MDY7572911.1 penicillin-binding protein 1A [Actimicrobium sp. CCI2.3]MEB0020756.1 penicillin-binding protein 1A [Actimicrobium sp. CCI2.3]
MLIAFLGLCGLGALTVSLLLGYAFLIIAPNMPSLDRVTDYKPKIPLRVFTADNVLIGEFGEEHRNFLPIKQIPVQMKNAVLAIEDSRFYEHGGVDFVGLLRAVVNDLGGGSAQGASTITMQVARNFFLTRDKTLSRKMNEIMLSYKIERTLSKDQILELYLNEIYLGQRSYGFGSAAKTYFGKQLEQLSVAQFAMLAGLPKAPSAYNPVVNPKRAHLRQQYILQRMRELNFITAEQYQQAVDEDIKVRPSGKSYAIHAEYAAEMVRKIMFAEYKDDIYTSGFDVVTTLRSKDQDAAYQALRRGVMNYERRHGYRGPEAVITLPSDDEERQDAIDAVLDKHPDSDELRAAVVTAASPKLVRATLLSGDSIELSGDGLRFAAAGLNTKSAAALRIVPGSVIRISEDDKQRWSIVQLPNVSAAFVALDPQSGAYRALVGGFDFNLNKFDHVTQAWRQPGSSIKPFIYSAALEKGFGPGTLINDAPLSIPAVGGTPLWEPQNDDNVYDGPVTMRMALAKSKNVVSVRVLQAITAQAARDHMGRFGFDVNKQPNNLTLALGTGLVTPGQMAGAYAVFANGGYQVSPYLIQTVTDARGKLLSQAKPVLVGEESVRVIDARNAFIMDSMLRDVTRYGTGAAASRLGRTDLAGKTGTTNDSIDGWFAGYGGDMVAVAWMGYDNPKSLGSREFGSTLALPVWMSFMQSELRGKPMALQGVPGGLNRDYGDWAYNEYAQGGGVRSLGLDEPGATPPPFETGIFGERIIPPDPSATRMKELYGF